MAVDMTTAGQQKDNCGSGWRAAGAHLRSSRRVSGLSSPPVRQPPPPLLLLEPSSSKDPTAW